LKCFLAALVFAASYGSVHAIVLDIGNLLGGSVSLARLFVSPASFIDVFNFTLSGPAAVSFDWTLAGLSGVTLTPPGGVSVAAASGTLLTDPLGVGAYSASLGGTASADGNYAITLGAVPVPVPEPAGWMLFVAGLALVALIARRRLTPSASPERTSLPPRG
jgi:hypothetical protein